MLTIHAGTDGEAVLVEGDRIAAVAPPAELAALEAAYPRARVRRWPGALGPGLVHEGPLPQGPSPRERVHALLSRGVTAVVGDAGEPEVRAALTRGGLARVPAAAVLRTGGRADLAVFDTEGACIATVLAGRLVYRRR